jgi:pyruvate/2-oxoglutarate dehydrogenase complex dihydrolipoamide dehydrogenase (E3) component
MEGDRRGKQAMTVEYDLVVIGASAAGIAAAKTAARYDARVALIQQDEVYNAFPACLSLLQQATRQPGAVDWLDLAQRLQLLMLQQAAIDSFDSLAALGIDVIPDSGAFCRKPRLGFGVGDRILTARAYLVAMSLGEADPADWSLENLPQRLGQLAAVQQLSLLGGSPESVAIAQALARSGLDVTLSDSGPLLFRHESVIDPAMIAALQAVIEADGVRLLTHDPIATEVDVSLLGIGDRPLAVTKLGAAGLNLGAAKVRWNQDKIFVDSIGRASRSVYICCAQSPTVNPQSWAIRAIAQTHHALKLPWGRSREPLPLTTVLTHPPAVAIGLTEAQAKQQYGKGVYRLEQALNQQLQAQLTDRTTGFCQLIVRSNGTIVGAHILGDQALEWAPILALAMQEKIPIGAIGRLTFPSPTFAETLGQLAIAFQHQSRRSDLWRYGLEEFFAWRRYWAR